MMRLWIFTVLLVVACRGYSSEAALTPDRVEVKGGVVLTGQMDVVTTTSLHLLTPYAGLVEIDLASIERVVSAHEATGQLPGEIQVVMPDASPPVTTPLPEISPSVPIKRTAGRKAPPATSGEVRPWSLEAGLNLTGKSGNVDKFDINVTIDATMKRAYDRLDLYGRYAYGTNRSRRSTDEIILGGRYTNFLIESNDNSNLCTRCHTK